jgi:hypothetical protein
MGRLDDVGYILRGSAEEGRVGTEISTENRKKYLMKAAKTILRLA